ncbi:MAG: dihydrofolate reductase [Sphingobium sp.]
MVMARADNGVIGRDGDLPWRLPADLRRFRMLTADHPMIMGRRTFDSLPGLLPGRRHIVLTRDGNWVADGAEVVHDTPSALARVGGPVATVIGGAEIYRLFLPLADRIELTEVHADVEGDTSIAYPARPEWAQTACVRHPADGGRPAYSFVTLCRQGRSLLSGDVGAGAGTDGGSC